MFVRGDAFVEVFFHKFDEFGDIRLSLNEVVFLHIHSLADIVKIVCGVSGGSRLEKIDGIGQIKRVKKTAGEVIFFGGLEPGDI